MELNILFPFRNKFRQLGLSGRWWHRLAIVLFAITLCVGLLIRISVTIDDYGEKDGRLSSATGDFLDGEMKLGQNASPAEHQALNQHYEDASKHIRQEADEELWWNNGFTIGFLISLNYILQSLYRAIIYVAYGNRKGAESTGD